MIHPVKKVFITQVFGVNQASYAKFGFKGHNGVDYRAFLPNGDRCYEGGKSEVFAPHKGRVIERSFDAGGYGNYIKIENDEEGSVLAHLSSPALFANGEVNQGDLIGYQGNTGNSTAIHLHWGYYRIPRDRANGYGGMIDQEPLLKNGGDQNMSEIDDLKKKVAAYEIEVAAKNKQIGEYEDQVKGLKQKAIDEHKRGYEEGKASVPSSQLDIDLSGWEVNGLTVSTQDGNKTTSLNYKLK